MSANDIAIDSILSQYNPNDHSGEEFAEKIKEVRKMLTDSSLYDQIYDLDQYVDELKNYLFNKKAKLRHAYARHAHSYRKYLDDTRRLIYYYEKAHQVMSKEEVLWDNWVWYVEYELGTAYNKLHALEKSEYYYRLTEKALEQQNNPNLSRLYGNMAILFATKNDYQSSLQAALRGIEVGQRFNYQEGIAKNHLRVAEAYTYMSKLDSAYMHLSIADSIFVESGLDDDPDDLEKLYSCYVDYYEKAGDFQQMKETASLQLALLDSIHENQFRREYAKVHHKLAHTFVGLTMKDSAQFHIEKGLYCLTRNTEYLPEHNDDLRPENTFFDLYHLWGDLHINQYQDLQQNNIYLEKAVQTYDKALYVNNQIRDIYFFEGSDLQAIEEGNEVVNKLIDTYYILQENGVSIDLDKIELIFDQSKGLLLAKMNLRKKQFDQLTEDEQFLFRARIDSIEHIKSVDQQLGINEEQLLQELQQRNAELINLDLTKESRLYTGNYINYVVTDSYVYSLTKKGRKKIFQRLGDTHTILKTVQSAREGVIYRADINITKDLLKESHEHLLLPTGKLPSRFSILADVALQNFPFDILIDEQNQYLLESHVIDYRLNRMVDDRYQTNDRIYCLYPYYGESNANIVYARDEIYPLHFAEQEIEYIQTIFPNSSNTRFVDRNELSDIWSTSDIFHYAGHARSGSEKGKFILDGDKQAAFITGEQIASSFPALNLAVLSACETGIGENKIGEGTFSLARAFMEGGTREVINSLWVVNDQTTAELTKEFYSHLKSGSSSTLALRDAKLNYLATSTEDRLHPYYWAGFVGVTALEENQEIGYMRTSILSIACLLGIILFFKLFKHGR